MRRWKTADIVAAVTPLIQGGGKVHVEKPGGDYDTSCIMVVYGDGDPENWDNDAILVAGIVTDSLTFKRGDPDDMDVSIVQLRNRNSDSAGGIQTDDDVLAMDATRIGQWLRRGGFSVVPTWDDYF